MLAIRLEEVNTEALTVEDAYYLYADHGIALQIEDGKVVGYVHE